MRVNNYYLANSLKDAYEKLTSTPNSAVIAGGLWMKKVNFDYDTLIDLSGCKLDFIKEEKDYVEIGAMVSLNDFESHPAIRNISNGVLSGAIRQIMGPAFREMATVGGSIYGKYGFSDIVTVLLAHKVELVFYPDATITLDEYVKKPGFFDGILIKIRIYKELDSVSDIKSLERMRSVIEDRFGKIPAELDRLFDIVKIRLHAQNIGFEKVIIKNGILIAI